VNPHIYSDSLEVNEKVSHSMSMSIEMDGGFNTLLSDICGKGKNGTYAIMYCLSSLDWARARPGMCCNTS
jgi:hypothetical protein